MAALSAGGGADSYYSCPGPTTGTVWPEPDRTMTPGTGGGGRGGGVDSTGTLRGSERASV